MSWFDDNAPTDPTPTTPDPAGDPSAQIQEWYTTYLGREAVPWEIQVHLRNQYGMQHVLKTISESEEAKAYAAKKAATTPTPTPTTPIVGQYWNTPGYMRGFNAEKMLDPTHTTEKYNVARILSNYEATPTGLQAAMADLGKLGISMGNVNSGKIKMADGRLVDVGLGFGAGGGQGWWWGDDQGATDTAASTTPASTSSYSTGTGATGGSDAYSALTNQWNTFLQNYQNANNTTTPAAPKAASSQTGTEAAQTYGSGYGSQAAGLSPQAGQYGGGTLGQLSNPLAMNPAALVNGRRQSW